ncbi:MAG: hypothetical protein AAF990_23215 [Bacteroidota bacterium]
MKTLNCLCLLIFFCSSGILYGQDHSLTTKKNVVQKAHDRKVQVEEFINTDKSIFKAMIYTVDKRAVVGRTHHWFFKLADQNGQALNYANIQVKGYLKADPKIKFTYQGGVFPMCNEGKYIIGFVKVHQSGTWVLEATIDNFGATDQLVYEIEIPDQDSRPSADLQINP